MFKAIRGATLKLGLYDTGIWSCGGNDDYDDDDDDDDNDDNLFDDPCLKAGLSIQ